MQTISPDKTRQTFQDVTRLVDYLGFERFGFLGYSASSSYIHTCIFEKYISGAQSA